MYAQLVADAGAGGVNTLLGGRIYMRRVPMAATLPALVIQLVSATASNTIGGRRAFKQALIDAHLICEGMDISTLVPIADRIDTVIQGAKGVQDGANIVKFVQEDEREYDEDEGGKVYTHQIQSYRTAVHAV
jgi:hypothetical protein